ncbi:MAG: T9SS type A sorting domain-containing protein [Candidatus Delongbacteria bacterium]|nr:T9SS type A sorting domain-containing protein [Candidatus Delongbacteria bacterium]
MDRKRIRLLLLIMISLGSIIWADGNPFQWAEKVSPVNETLVDVIFPDPQHGWAVGAGSTILHTDDGGDTWHQQTLPISGIKLTKVFFPDSLHGYIISREYEKPGQIFKTIDGGKNWIQIDYPNPIPLYDLFFINADTGWIVGGDGFTDSSDKLAGILYTEDGGSNWIWQYQISRPHSYQIENFRSIVFMDSLNGYAMYFYGFDNSAPSTILQTHDGGYHWEELIVLNMIVDQIQLAPPDTMIAAGWMFYRSDDGGINWFYKREMTFDDQDVYTINDLEAISGKDIIILADTGGVSFHGDLLFYTDSYGQWWKDIGSDFINTELVAIEMVGDSTLWAVGTGGRIFKGIKIKTGLAESPDAMSDSDAITAIVAPNPFSGDTQIRFHLPVNGPVSVTVYNSQGQSCRQIFQGSMIAGDHTLVWHGRDRSGTALPSGLYFIKIENQSASCVVKSILIK